MIHKKKKISEICLAISAAVELVCFLRKSMTGSSSGVKDLGMILSVILICLLLLCLFIFLINNTKHPFDELVTAVMTLTSAHSSDV